MTVNELRKELSKKNLDVEGSKETLMSRLENATKQHKTVWEYNGV